jgi:hypothetical protein
MSFLLMLLLNIASSHASELTCMKPGLFRFQLGSEKVSEPSSYCFDADLGLLQSANCENGNCEALKKDVCNLDLKPGTFGTSGSKICEKVGGFFQKGAYYDGKAWWDADRCLFAGDKSFVDSGSLSARRGQCFQN